MDRSSASPRQPLSRANINPRERLIIRTDTEERRSKVHRSPARPIRRAAGPHARPRIAASPAEEPGEIDFGPLTVLRAHNAPLHYADSNEALAGRYF